MAFRLKWKEGQEQHLHEAKPSSPDFVNSKMECLDFDNHASKVIIQNEVKEGMPRVEWFENQRVFVFILVGFLTGVFGSFIVVCSEKGSHLKYHNFIHLFNDWYNTSYRHFLFLIIFGFMFGFAMVGTVLAVYIEPKAAGGGLAPVIGYVNGVKVPGALTCKTLIVKTFSLICCMNAGLAAGMEAPMVHVGACVAHSLVNVKIPFTNIRPFDDLHTDTERRDLVGAGIAAGIVGAFSTPIGGVLMALEEGTTFFSVAVLVRFLLCAVSSAITVNVILTLFSNHPGSLTEQHLLFFVVLKESNLQFYIEEFPFYLLIGIIGGLLGAAFNAIQIQFIILRKKHITKKWQQMVEMIIVVLATSGFYYVLLVTMSGYCVDKKPGISEAIDMLNSVKLDCSDDQFNIISVFSFQAVPNVIRFMFVDSVGDISWVPLFIYAIGFFILSVCTMGTMIAAGIFIPNLAIGATWGRMFGQVLRDATGWEWIHPHKYAFLASGAQLTGVVRIPFTISVLMMEATGNTKLGFAVFTSIIVSYMVASLFNQSIYHHQCAMAGMALIHTDPPPFCSRITAEELMSSPAVTLPKKVTVEAVKNILNSNSHNCYPIVMPGGTLEGSISRNLLIILVKRGMFPGVNSDQVDMDILRKEHLSKQNIKMIEDIPGERILDLDPYMDPTPHTVSPQTSFDSVYRLISCLGLRHIIVVDTSYKVLGVITRKKLSVYRMHVNLYHASVTKLAVR